MIRFVKMHGIGNDFVVLNSLEETSTETDLAALAIRLCDRRTGVGADGLVLALPSRRADFRMRIFNSDGSEAGMCGNGIRCLAKYVFDHNLTQQTKLTFETASGLLPTKLYRKSGIVRTVQVEMGFPKLAREDIPMLGASSTCIGEQLKVGGTTYSITAVHLGNPHVIVIVEDVARVNVETVGPLIENHKLFPKKTNVHFVQPLGPSEFRMRSWERGAGLTLACGTGASASLVACSLAKKTKREATAHLPGGDLEITWLGNNLVTMTGPAEQVFEGEFDPR